MAYLLLFIHVEGADVDKAPDEGYDSRNFGERLA
jgi:hypothetical protein